MLQQIGQLAYHGVTSVFSKDKVKFYHSPVELLGKKVGEGQRTNKNYMVQPLMASPAPLLPHRRAYSFGISVYLIQVKRQFSGFTSKESS